MLKALAGVPGFTIRWDSPSVPMCLSLCEEGVLLHPCAVFDRRTCSRLQACRKSWSRSLTAWTPAFPRQSVSFPDASQLCWESSLSGELVCHLYLAGFLAGMGSPWSPHNLSQSGICAGQSSRGLWKLLQGCAKCKSWDTEEHGLEKGLMEQGAPVQPEGGKCSVGFFMDGGQWRRRRRRRG